MPCGRPTSDVLAVLGLQAAGWSDREVSRATGVPVNTIRGWRNKRLPRRIEQMLRDEPRCPQCDDEPHDFEALPKTLYAYLLGLYLGDGWIARNGKSWTLSFALDSSYPGIIEECSRTLEELCGRRAHVRPYPRGQQCVVVSCTSRSWPCLIPQHGPGRKHHRRIELVPWQQKIVDSEPGAFLRGLIHTDGWRGVNRVHTKGRDYAYPRYQFSNRSDDCRRLFTRACDKLGVEWRPWTRYHISVAKRRSVALLDAFVGPKS